MRMRQLSACVRLLLVSDGPRAAGAPRVVLVRVLAAYLMRDLATAGGCN
jgi:hypothetical protein